MTLALRRQLFAVSQDEEFARVTGLPGRGLSTQPSGAVSSIDSKKPSFFGISGSIIDAIWAQAKASYDEKDRLVGGELLRRVERDIMLQIVDAQWKDHLYSLDHLKEGIGLRGYGQRDPLVEYKKESFALFQDMRRRIEEGGQPTDF